jgi:hypothetical protein
LKVLRYFALIFFANAPLHWFMNINEQYFWIFTRNKAFDSSDEVEILEKEVRQPLQLNKELQ